MAYGMPANVRSHRRGGSRRRGRRLAPWISVAAVAAVVAAGLVVGFQQLLAQTCSGEESVRVVAAPATANLLGEFATEWNRGEPQTGDGTCARVTVAGEASAVVADNLAGGWDREADPPQVWVPESTAWAEKAAASDVAEPMIPDLRPSIARTPTVIAMPEPMAVELGWPETQLAPDADVRWESMLQEFADDQTGAQEGWSRLGRPEWGAFRFGMTDPARDTAGLLSLTAILDTDQTGETSPDQLDNAIRLHRMLRPELYHESTEQLLGELAEADEQGTEAALRYVSAFPVLEQDVFEYNQREPEVPLAAVYPINGNIEADNPYLVLNNADWVTDATREVAEMFLAHVRSSGPQATLREAGFRGTNREAGDDFTEQYGLVPQLVALPRAVLIPESVSLAIDRWTALTRPFNVIIAFDVSGSMLQEIPGTGEARLERAMSAAAQTVALFTDEDRVGFWDFSTALEGDRDYRELVPLGGLGDTMEDGRTRREHIGDAIATLTSAADTGLYNTVRAGYDAVLANYQPDATNLLVVLTDGENDTGGRPSVTLEELRGHLEEAPAEEQQVQLVPVTFGEEAAFDAMAELSALTGGEAYFSPDGFDLVDLLRTAIFGQI